MSELQSFLAMLERAGLGHGTRRDFNPDGTAVQVEHEDTEGEVTTDWRFDARGDLISVTVCTS